MKFLGLLFSILLVGFSSHACDFQIDKIAVPLKDMTIQSPICLEDYFIARDFANYSQGFDRRGNLEIIQDAENIYFNDMLLFSLPGKEKIPLQAAGRLKLVKNIYAQLFSHMNGYFGACELNLYDGNKKLSIDDFKFYAREEEGQPGSRLMLTTTDIPKSRWEVVCPLKEGGTYVTKSGNYFFLFVDVYENIGTSANLKDHFAQFLFSLN